MHRLLRPDEASHWSGKKNYVTFCTYKLRREWGATGFFLCLCRELLEMCSVQHKKLCTMYRRNLCTKKRGAHSADPAIRHGFITCNAPMKYCTHSIVVKLPSLLKSQAIPCPPPNVNVPFRSAAADLFLVEIVSIFANNAMQQFLVKQSGLREAPVRILGSSAVFFSSPWSAMHVVPSRLLRPLD